jgi:hypothetical protein
MPKRKPISSSTAKRKRGRPEEKGSIRHMMKEAAAQHIKLPKRSRSSLGNLMRVSAKVHPAIFKIMLEWPVGRGQRTFFPGKPRKTKGASMRTMLSLASLNYVQQCEAVNLMSGFRLEEHPTWGVIFRMDERELTELAVVMEAKKKLKGQKD